MTGDQRNQVMLEYPLQKEIFAPLVEEYFPNRMIVLDELYRENKIEDLNVELNVIWFQLPDYINIASSYAFNALLKVIDL